MTMHPWGSHDVPDGGELDVEIGPLSLFLRRAQGELRARVERHGEPEDDGRWTRWAADLERVSLTPTFADRALVVEPEDPFWLVQGSEARIYVRVPVWVRVEGHERDRAHSLLHLPSAVASDTWWGTLEEGELCYWLPTRARRVLDAGEVQPHLVICPLQLVNQSEGDLHVEKIALRVAYLSLYAHGGGLWSDETRVVYIGDAEGSRLEMAGTPPPEAPSASLVTPPTRRMARGFRARTFRRLRSIASLFE